jgi:hypothetical protein
VLSLVKWLTASVVALWQSVHGRLLCWERLWLLDVGPLYCVVPYTWQLEHWVFTVIVPVCQLGAVCPPWQLTLAHVRVALSNEDAPVFALYVVTKATSPGAARNAFLPGRALARS